MTILARKILCFDSFGVILHAEILQTIPRMTVINTITQMHTIVNAAKSEGKSVGLVPTMGALHAGHASLIRKSVAENDVTVVSIFVNPTQFNDKNDLQNYPRTLEADCQLIESIGGTYVFAPTVAEVYPEPDTRTFSYPPIDSVMEGVRRPGHFNGVCQIVSKLFAMVNPDRAYFGEKDFQQIAVIRAMMKDQGFNFDLISCPIVREENGLALSSRNTLLTSAEREIAVNISRTLIGSLPYAKSHTVEETRTWVIEVLNAIVGLKVEYYEIVDAITLQNICHWDDAEHVQGCITVFCGATPIRLIDNINYK